MGDAERYGGGNIIVCDYEPEWLTLFELERERVAHALGPTAIAIEHVGSTAVPGLAAKPIIDLLVTVRSLPEVRSICIDALQPLGYAYVEEYEAWLTDEMLFRKALSGAWTHHLHVTEPSSPRWEEYVLIRDYLRRHREIADAYGQLKQALALMFEDNIAGYRDAKRPALQALLAKARADPYHPGDGEQQ